MNNSDFSTILKKLRIEKGITQAGLAAILQISQKTVAHLENDYRKPSYELLISIANYYSVSLDYLCGRSNDPAIHQLEQTERAEIGIN